MLINSYNSSNVNSLINFNSGIEELKNTDRVETVNQNNIQDSLSISLDSEAQKLLAAVGNDLQDGTENLASVHQGLDYSRVMQLLEGL